MMHRHGLTPSFYITLFRQTKAMTREHVVNIPSQSESAVGRVVVVSLAIMQLKRIVLPALQESLGLPNCYHPKEKTWNDKIV